MDLVSQIVATKSNVALDEIRRGLESLCTSTNSLKSQMLDQLNDSKSFYIRNCMLDKCVSSFSKELDQLMESFAILEDRIQSLRSNNEAVVSDSENSVLFTKLGEIFEVIESLCEVDEVETLMRSVGKQCGTDPLSTATTLMNCKKKIKKDMERTEFKNLYHFLFEKCCIDLSSFRHSLIENWSKSVSFVYESKCGNLKTNKIRVKLNANPSINEIFECLIKIRYPIMKSFGNNFFNSFLKPALIYPSEVNIYEVNSVATISLSFYEEHHQQPLEEGFSCLVDVVNFMNQYLNLSSKVDNVHLVRCLGSECEERLFSLLMEHPLLDVKLNNSISTDWLLTLFINDFILKDSKLVMHLEDLIERPIYGLKSKTLTDVFKCLKADLLDCRLVEPMAELVLGNENLFNCELTVNMQTLRLENIINIDYLSRCDKKFLFPQCRVSKPIIDLVSYMEELLIKSFEEESLRASIWRSLHDVVELYLVSPRLHTSSTDSAQIFNNSMYLAVNLLKFENDHHTGLPFCGMVYKLQHLGLEGLDKVVKAVHDQLTSHLSSTGLAESLAMDTLPNDTIIAVKKCAQQIKDLHNIWSSILPSDVCNMALGYLCGEMIQDISTIVMSAKVINSSIKSSLIAFFISLSNDFSDIIQEEENLEKYIKEWGKWKALIQVLESSPVILMNEWGSGEGTLASFFNHSQMYNFVLALHPPSDARDKLLQLF